MQVSIIVQLAVLTYALCSVTSAKSAETTTFDKTDAGYHVEEPQQIHLAYAGKEPGTAMTISWATFALVKDPAVWIGTSNTTIAKVKTVRIETKSYYRDDHYTLYNYHAVVTGLKPYTEYFYKVSSAANPKAQSTVSSFKTARSSGDKSPFVVAIVADLDTEANAVATNKYLNSLVGKVDFMMHCGDISYADNDFFVTGDILGFHYEDIWNKFINSLSTVMRRMAYMVVVGNHEAECHSPACVQSEAKKDQLGNYTAFNTRFKMPSSESGGAKNMWYSFVYGLMHVVVCSSETDYPNSPSNAYFTNRTYGNFGNQLAWLEADLKAAHANRANVPWIVVAMHRPIYSLSYRDANSVPTDVGTSFELQKAFEKLLIKYRVDVVFHGHVHAYERSCPTANSKAIMDGVSKDGRTYLNPCFPVYVITGHGGNWEGPTVYDTNSVHPKRFTVMDNTHFGITKLSVTPTSLTVTMIESATEKVYDEFSIIKDGAARNCE